MLNNGFRVSYIISTLLITIFLILFGITKNVNNEPITVYNVYLKGKIIGVVKDKNSFENYINDKENVIKKKYGVDKVYMPNGVVIKKMMTYDKNIDSNAVVYNKIIKLKQFTIKGTVITIKNKVDKNVKDKKIYVLNKEIFDEALEELIKSFVDNDQYKSYMESTQKEIVDTGNIIKNIDISEKITYKNTYISIDKKIYTKKSDVAQYLLYGTNKKQKSYIVKDGDTIDNPSGVFYPVVSRGSQGIGSYKGKVLYPYFKSTDIDGNKNVENNSDENYFRNGLDIYRASNGEYLGTYLFVAPIKTKAYSSSYTEIEDIVYSGEGEKFYIFYSLGYVFEVNIPIPN